KGSSTIAIKSASDLCKIRPNSYTEWKWKYYLANDIDMTGKGIATHPNVYPYDSYEGIYLDGKGKKIKSDTPIFTVVGGTVKNIVFDVNMKCKVSKNDAVSKIWSDVHYNSYRGIAPIVENNGTLTNCKATGSITIDYDKTLLYKGNDSKPTNELSYVWVSGLASWNNNSAKISNCRSDVDIAVTFSENTHPFAYIGGLVCENYGYEGNGQYATISESLYDGRISVTGNSSAYVGGLCGTNQSMISDCLFTGTIEGSDYINSAGITGWDNGKGKTVERILTTGNAKYALDGYSRSKESLNLGVMSDYKDAYYLKSKYDAFYYLGEPFEVPGVTAVDDADLTNQSFFSGFDFTNVWEMGAGGPKLRNVPA
ncbi:MAG: hypothetical protein K5639_06845, partial [Eubacterium sp.]|nr:hypothetical protein [Eubacterium sp.]